MSINIVNFHSPKTYFAPTFLAIDSTSPWKFTGEGSSLGVKPSKLADLVDLPPRKELSEKGDATEVLLDSL